MGQSWKITQEVLFWFLSIKNMIKFDVQEFYPSVTEELQSENKIKK